MIFNYFSFLAIFDFKKKLIVDFTNNNTFEIIEEEINRYAITML